MKKIILSVLMLSVLILGIGAVSAASVSTNKAEYALDDIAYISGEGFMPNTEISAMMVYGEFTGEESYAEFDEPLITDENGDFFLPLKLGDEYGKYSIKLSDGEKEVETSLTYVEDSTMSTLDSTTQWSNYNVDTYSNHNYNVLKDEFYQGETVYVKGTSENNKRLKISIINSNNNQVHFCEFDSHWWNWDDEIKCSWNIPTNAIVSDNWKVKLQDYYYHWWDNDWETVDTESFEVLELDDEAPLIENIVVEPVYPTCSDYVTICADVTDASNLSIVLLGYHSLMSPLRSGDLEMTTEDGITYCTDLSVASLHAEDAREVTYSIFAEDEFGNEDESETLSYFYDCMDPTAVITGDLTCNEGSDLLLSAEDSSDTVDTELEYSWMWTHLGVSYYSQDEEITINCIDDDSISVSLTIKDNVNRTNTATETVQVMNVKPVGDIDGATTADEGTTVELTASATDVGVQDTHTFEWFLNGTSTGTGATFNVACIDEELHYVSMIATDNNGGIADAASHEIQCYNVNPVIDAGEDISVPQGQLFTLNPIYSDAGVLDLLTLSYHYGDDWVSENSHMYCEVAEHTVTIQVDDGDGGKTSDTLIVDVTNVLPTIISTGEPYIGIIGEEIIFTATGSDVCNDTLTIEWNFGEGYSEDDTHFWTTPFSGTVGLRIIDEYDGIVETTVQVDIYDYAIELDKGWNIISIPLVPEEDDTSIENVFSIVSENVDAVWAYTWDELQNQNVWTFNDFNEGVASSTDSLQRIIPGYGYYVKMAEEDVLYLNGKVDYQVGGEENSPVMGMPPSVTLATDSWNLIGVFGLKEESNARDNLISLTNSLGLPYYDIILNENAGYAETLESKEGYWLSVKLIPQENTIQYKTNPEEFWYYGIAY